MAEIRFDRVRKSYGRSTAVDTLDFIVPDGEFLSLLGPSGCGKSTTLRLIAGFVDPTEGRILLDGRDVTGLAPQLRSIGMVFQDYALFPHLTVSDNIAFGLRARGVPRARRASRAAELLDLVQLQGLGSRYPAQLSGGQQQRVALARALAFPPAVLLMDEPLGALDLKLREAMQEEIRRIQRELRVTTIYVTHDQNEAMNLSDRIAVMQAGRIVQIGTPREIYNAPANRFVAGFVGRINFIPGRIGRRDAAVTVVVGSMELALPHGSELSPGSAITLAVRPENIRFAGADRCRTVPAVIEQRSFAGNVVLVRAHLHDGTPLLIEARQGDATPPDGASAFLTWDAADTIVLADT